MQSLSDLVHCPQRENKSHYVVEVFVLLSSKSAPADAEEPCACAEPKVGRSTSASAVMSLYQRCYHLGNANPGPIAINFEQQK